MPLLSSIARDAARLLGMATLVVLAACAGDRDPPSDPSFYRSLAAGGELDAAAAGSMISGYRSHNGLTAVTLDPALLKAAEAHAPALAGRDQLTPHRIRG